MQYCCQWWLTRRIQESENGCSVSYKPSFKCNWNVVYKLEDLKSATKSTSEAGIGEIFPWTEDGNNCKQAVK